jgi:cyclomaltodextrinase / maltogenic alpha-amylase / neopullulanase
MKKVFLFVTFVFICILFNMCAEQTKTVQISEPPEWSKNVIWYQIFVERFNNGDPSNDPKPENIKSASDFYPIPNDWSVTPWTHNWYEQEDWAKKISKNFYGTLQLRRFGGDLQGVLDKLDYLSDLGITAIYLNPINDAPSLHKYDARNFHHVDVNFGPDPVGDNLIIASENPADPSTWKWTSADKLFLKLVEEVHKRGMRIIIDYSWNHTGVEFWAWKDILKNQEKSPYKDWFEILSFDNQSTDSNEFDYKGWLNIRSLPEIRKVDVVEKRVNGRPYEGNINEGAKQHVFAVTKRWLSPDGDVTKGIDGYRLDVADQIPMGFWRDYRKYVKSINPDAYLVGEIWWEKWPDKLMDPVPYVSGDIFDGIMFYQLYVPARGFFAKNDFPLTAKQFTDSLNNQWAKLKVPFQYSMMNVSSSHDSPRLLTCFDNPGKYKYNAKPSDDSTYRTGKPDTETYERVKLYLIHQFTNIGSPHIWNGDEMGMWGADDPDCRKPLWWKEFQFEPETRTNLLRGKKVYDTVGFNEDLFNFYKKIIRIRKENPVLSNGELEFFNTDNKHLSYRRFNQKDEILVLFNLGNEKFEFNLAPNKAYHDLLSDKTYSAENLMLDPISAIILKTIHSN